MFHSVRFFGCVSQIKLHEFRKLAKFMHFDLAKFTLKIIMSAIPRKDLHIELDHENIKLDLTAHLQMLSWWKDNKNNNTSNYNLTKKTRWI